MTRASSHLIDAATPGALPTGGLGSGVPNVPVGHLSQQFGFSDGLGEQAMEGAQRVSDAIQGLPVTAHGVAVAAVIAGLILWLGGSKVVKPMFAVVGAIGGALAGSVLLPGLGFATVFGFPGEIVGLAGGAIGGSLLAAGAFRVVMAVIASVAFGVAGLLIGTAYVDREIADAADASEVEVAPLQEIESPGEYGLWTEPLNDPMTEPVRERVSIQLTSWSTPSVIDFDPADRGTPETNAAETTDAGGATTEDAANEQIQAVVEASRAFIAAGLDTFEGRWATYAPEQRLRIFGFTLAGLLIGFIVGANLPNRSAAVVTAIAGSAVWVLGIWWLTIAMGWPFAGAFDRSPQDWLIVWGVLSAIGALSQLTALKKVGKRSKPKPTRDRSGGEAATSGDGGAD